MADKLRVDLEVAGEPAASAKVNRFTSNLRKADADIKSLGAGNSFAGAFDKQLAAATIRHKVFVDRIKKQNAEIKAPTSGGFAGGGFLGGIGAGIGGGLAGGALLTAANTALNAAKAAEDANRVLRASAVETGIAYDQLAAKADKFGKATALSNTDAQRTFAQLVNFANAAGRTDKLDEFQRRFADLAAAKGINASQLGDISRQLNALTDEATDKLLNANPSAFYAKFAASLGKTAEQLTDAEKRAAIFDEVLKKGAIFTGEAERRTKSFAGEADNLRKTIDDLTAATGRALVPLAQFVLRGGQVDRKLFMSDAERAEIRRNGEILGDARAAALAEGLRASDAKINAAKLNPLGSAENFALSQVDIAKTFIDPAGREKAITAAIEGANLFIDGLKKRLQTALSSGSTGLAKLANTEFRKNINLFDLETRDKFINDFSTAIASGFRETLSKTKVTVAELRKTLAEVGKSPDLTQKDRDAVSKDFTAAILQQINAGRAKVEDLGRSTDQLFAQLFAKRGAGNPFVAVFTEAQIAIEQTRLATAGLSADLQKQALDLVAANNSNSLFTARLDSRLQSVDLRGDARSFRESGRKPFIDPAILATPGGFDRFAREQADKLVLSGNNSALNFSSLISSLVTGRNQPSGDQTAQERLNRQLAVIRDLRPENEFQRAEADRKIIALTQGLNPADLTEAQRNAAAAARENEASRLDNAETTAKAERTEAATVQKSIDKNIADLLKIAQSEGLTGVIRIINDAEDTTRTSLGKRKRATEADAADIMD